MNRGDLSIFSKYVVLGVAGVALGRLSLFTAGSMPVFLSVTRVARHLPRAFDAHMIIIQHTGMTVLAGHGLAVDRTLELLDGDLACTVDAPLLVACDTILWRVRQTFAVEQKEDHGETIW
jgi:hypothetical protein